MRTPLIATLFLLALTSCGSTTRIMSSVLDYRPYTDNGFFISPNQYPGEHQPLGEISITVVPGTKDADKKPKEMKFSDGIYDTKKPVKQGKSSEKPITPESLLELCVQKAMDMGANGISNFKCEVIYNVAKSRYGTISFIDHYEVYGLGIKIEN